MKDRNGKEHDESNGQFTSMASTPAELKRADEITGEEQNPQDISGLLGEEFTELKGQAAIEKLLKEKQGHVKGAFHRDDIGDIDLLWGNESLGLQHILTRREEQGVDSMEFVKDLTAVIENGKFRKKNERGNFEFIDNGKVVIISPELRNNKITFLLTAFKTHSKK